MKKILNIINGWIMAHTRLDLIHEQYGLIRRKGNGYHWYRTMIPLNGSGIYCQLSYEEIGKLCVIAF